MSFPPNFSPLRFTVSRSTTRSVSDPQVLAQLFLLPSKSCSPSCQPFDHLVAMLGSINTVYPIYINAFATEVSADE